MIRYFCVRLGTKSNLNNDILIEMKFTNTSCAFALFALGLPHTGFTQQPTKRPNILFIMTDQQRWYAPYQFASKYIEVIPAGKKVETPVSHHDIFATILDYSGMKTPENDGPFMIRKGDWKMIVYLKMGDKKQKNTNALFNLKTDPLELNNLIGNNPEKEKYMNVTTQLKQTLKNWIIKTKTPYIAELDKTAL